MEHDTAYSSALAESLKPAAANEADPDLRKADDSDGQAVPSGTWSPPSSTLEPELKD